MQCVHLMLMLVCEVMCFADQAAADCHLCRLGSRTPISDTAWPVSQHQHMDEARTAHSM